MHLTLLCRTPYCHLYWNCQCYLWDNLYHSYRAFKKNDPFPGPKSSELHKKFRTIFTILSQQCLIIWYLVFILQLVVLSFLTTKIKNRKPIRTFTAVQHPETQFKVSAVRGLYEKHTSILKKPQSHSDLQTPVNCIFESVRHNWPNHLLKQGRPSAIKTKDRQLVIFLSVR